MRFSQIKEHILNPLIRLWSGFANPLVILSILSSLTIAQPSDIFDMTAQEFKTLLTTAKSLIVRGSFEQAYQLLKKQEVTCAGIVSCDYLFGSAALDSGHSSEAVFILQRAVDVDKNFSGARLELARALFEAGNLERSRFHFEYLLKETPPANVLSVIDNYLRAINRLAGAYKTVHIPYLEVGTGYDNNANASTNIDEFLGFILNEDNVKTQSPFIHLVAGDFYSMPLTADIKWSVFGSIYGRFNTDAQFVNSQNISINTQLSWLLNDLTVSSGLGVNQYWRDGDSNFNNSYINADLAYSLTPVWTIKSLLQANVNRFDRELETRDNDQLLLRIGAEHLSVIHSGNVTSAYLLAGTDDARQSDSPYGNDRYGLQLRQTWLLRPHLLLDGEIVGTRNDYDTDKRFFGEKRRDKYYRASMKVHWFDKPSPQLRLTVGINFSKNSSNVELFDYDRTEVYFSIYRAFE